ncbi:hypothetical protein EYF80_033764 [Liparis tanakae]|uniref:Uncharacterized protein n=1 Tax=Liparis tanakae TaxID=230148 RepID=A0A4Z2GQU5_9TELE|nr:hypothetical protein EYF80_033764 [Liparis tanakae]
MEEWLGAVGNTPMGFMLPVVFGNELKAHREMHEGRFSHRQVDVYKGIKSLNAELPVPPSPVACPTARHATFILKKVMLTEPRSVEDARQHGAHRSIK